MKKGRSMSNSERGKHEKGKTLLVMLALVVVILFVVVLFLDSPTGQGYLMKNAPALAQSIYSP